MTAKPLLEGSDTAPFRLADVCPRLAKARDDYNAWVWQQGIEKRRRSTELYRAEKLLAHRELQLIRAERTGNSKYIRQRHGKLRAAQAAVNALRKDAA